MFRKKPSKSKLLVSGLILVGLVGLLFFLRHSAGAPGGDSKNGARSQTPSFNKSLHPTDQPDSIWVVVNKSRPMNPTTYAPPDLVSVGGGQMMRQEAATALQQLFAGATAAGYKLQPLSGYRSYTTQQSVYAREVATNGQAKADTQSAKPGYSEHQTGLAIDVGGGGCNIEDCFGTTAEGKWVAAHAHEYGFMIRYVPGKEDITGYRPEPWHLRYVSTDLAAELKRTNTQTLEEFFGL
jgi:D-alanyl-D-alanine carboxypeptidase